MQAEPSSSSISAYINPLILPFYICGLLVGLGGVVGGIWLSYKVLFDKQDFNVSLGYEIFFIIVIVTFVIIFFLTSLLPLLRVPLKLAIKDGKIITWGFHGHRSLSLRAITHVRADLIMGNRYGQPIMGLRLSDEHGNVVFLQLGALRRRDRMRFYSPINDILSDTTVQKEGKIFTLWAEWYPRSN